MKYLTCSDVAELIGYGKRLVQRRLEGFEPVETKGRTHYYCPKDVIKALAKEVKNEEKAALKQKLVEAELYLRKQKALRLELLNDKDMENLHPVKECQEVQSAAWNRVASVMRTLPSRLSVSLSDDIATRKQEIEQIVAGVISDMYEAGKVPQED